MKTIYILSVTLILTAILFTSCNVETESVSLITNPDNGTGVSSNPIIFNNNLYFIYYAYKSGICIPQLAKYDGTSITLIANTDEGVGFDPPIVYKNNLYFGYKNQLSMFLYFSDIF
jgi:hypothetical protein